MLRRLWTWLWIATTPLAVTVLAAETEHAAEEHGGEHVLDNPIQNVLDFGYKSKGLPAPFSMQLLNFAAFLFIIGKYAGPSMKKAVRERHDRIKRDLEESARLRAEAQRKVDEYGAKLASLQAEIDKLVSTIRAEAEAEKRRILGDAQARADRMKRDAEMQVQAEIQRVRLMLEREAVVAAVALAEKLLVEKTTDVDQKALADRFLKALV
ncbi:MAG TPA: ATP synthase F0 subunit B [Haliangiales bacterium]|nr:ATP synthase F0 subunit B [Haliangiales bacterium]